MMIEYIIELAIKLHSLGIWGLIIEFVLLFICSYCAYLLWMSISIRGYNI